MGQLFTGISAIIFGLIIGGVGVATAGSGIGIPMIPLGIYLMVRGYRSWQHEKRMEKSGTYNKQVVFEKTVLGKAVLGVLLILIGIPTSALIIGIPAIGVGIYLLIRAYLDFKAAKARKRISYN